jgi:hypothetical protein
MEVSGRITPKIKRPNWCVDETPRAAGACGADGSDDVPF